MRKLASDTQETVHLGILDASHVVYIAKMEGRRGLQMASHVGLQSPAQTTAMGKVLLASLPRRNGARRYMNLAPATPHSITDREAFVRELTEVRAQGYAFDREENEVGIRCVAAPSSTRAATWWQPSA